MINPEILSRTWLDPESYSVLEDAAKISHVYGINRIDRTAILLGLYLQGHLPGIFRYQDGITKFLAAYRIITDRYATEKPMPCKLPHVPFERWGKHALLTAADRALEYHAGIVKPEDLTYSALDPEGSAAAMIESLGTDPRKFRPQPVPAPILTWGMSGIFQVVASATGANKELPLVAEVVKCGVVLPHNL